MKITVLYNTGTLTADINEDQFKVGGTFIHPSESGDKFVWQIYEILRAPNSVKAESIGYA